jgi:cytochrome c-type biogenesis protein CcmH/NrfF
MINQLCRTLIITIIVTLCLAASSNTLALTVAEVAKDLACPCQCPLILQDCNMSCGITWKNEIGELIIKGMNKQQIMDYFISAYGESARLTTRQKLDGKIYQYTRSFDTIDWAILWSGITAWMLILFLGIYLAVRRALPSSKILVSGDIS